MAARRILKRSGSDSEDEYLGKSSLPVTQDKVIDDDSFVPATGEDYLLMVRYVRWAKANVVKSTRNLIEHLAIVEGRPGEFLQLWWRPPLQRPKCLVNPHYPAIINFALNKSRLQLKS